MTPCGNIIWISLQKVPYLWEDMTCSFLCEFTARLLWALTAEVYKWQHYFFNYTNMFFTFGRLPQLPYRNTSTKLTSHGAFLNLHAALHSKQPVNDRTHRLPGFSSYHQKDRCLIIAQDTDKEIIVARFIKCKKHLTWHTDTTPFRKFSNNSFYLFTR